MNNSTRKDDNSAKPTMAAVYRGFDEAYASALAGATNLALRFERLCPYGPNETGQAAKFNFTQQASQENQADSEKQRWLNQFDGEKAGNPKQLESVHERQAQLCQQLGGQQFELALDWRFLSGGGAHPLENSLIWHPTLAVPYLPGSAFKGLLRAFLAHWQGEKARLVEYFGNTGQAGELLFFDVLPLGPVTLKADVMTPHYGNWYAAGGGDAIELRPENIPAPWHNPVPIPFLVVQAPLRLRAMLAVRGNTGADWDALEALLKDAFAVAGAGAKTASGYGRMQLETGWRGFAAQQAAQLQRDAAEREAQAQAAERAARAAQDQAREQARLQQLAERKAAAPADKLPEFLQTLRGKGDGKALAGYLQGKNFGRDLEQWGLTQADVKTAMHADLALLAMIRGWVGKKGKEGEAYEAFKPPKKTG